MSKAIITITDSDDGESVKINVTFESKLDERSNAHNMAAVALKAMQGAGDDDEESELRAGHFLDDEGNPL